MTLHKLFSSEVNKYEKAVSALKRALLHDEELIFAKGARKIAPFDSVALRLFERFSSRFFALVVLCTIFGGGRFFTFLTAYAWVIGAVILSIIGLIGALHVTQEFKAIRRRNHQAQDKVDTRMSFANLPWQIDRTVLKTHDVEYKLLIPPEDINIFSGSPSISISAQAAEKADLLILAIRADQKLIEKWSNRTLNMWRFISKELPATSTSIC